MSSVTHAEFGAQLLTKDGSKSTEEVLKNKRLVGVYFSAHWCPPCRGFTPVLAEFYDQLKEEDGNGDAIEIIFVSSDSDEASFNDYFGTMPWTSMPFNSPAGQSLAQKFGIRGIPSFLVFDAAGNLVDREGRNTVASAKGVTSHALSKWFK